MATLTLPHSSFAGGSIEFDISDVNWKISKIRCHNFSGQPARGFIYELGELVFTADAPSGEITEWNVTNVQLGWQPDYWNDVTEEWESGGIEMGDYVLACQFPAEELP